jgi:Cu/Ag efflux pump CusA
VRNALVVPSNAILLEEGGAFVFTLEGERLQRVAVQLGPRVGEPQIIVSGIDGGEQVVVRDVAALAGDRDWEIWVEVDPQVLSARAVSLQQLIAAVRSNLHDLPGGSLNL